MLRYVTTISILRYVTTISMLRYVTTISNEETLFQKHPLQDY